ncbi:MAG TPA: hypothetical protein VNS49_21125 [Streptomyces sp.]|nr:hypothetical protein [Streptomyces sp.]
MLYGDLAPLDTFRFSMSRPSFLSALIQVISDGPALTCKFPEPKWTAERTRTKTLCQQVIGSDYAAESPVGQQLACHDADLVDAWGT